MSTKSAAQLANEYRQSDLERTIDQLQRTVESLENALEKARSDVMELAQAREEARTQREETSMVARLEKEVGTGVEELTKQRQAYKEIAIELVNREGELKKACPKVASAEKELEGVREELAVAQQELRNTRAECQELNARLLVTCSELEHLRAEHSVYRTSQEGISHAQQLALSAREKELEELRATASHERTVSERAVAEQRESLERDLIQTRDEAIHWRQDAVKKELELKELRERLAVTQREIENLRASVFAPVKKRSPSPAGWVASSSKTPHGVVIDLSADSNGEATSNVTPFSHPLISGATGAVEVEGGISATPPVAVSKTNATPAEPGREALRSPDVKQLKRAADDVDARDETPSKPSKRIKKSQKSG
ncbi:hypothetical protein PENSPDRAFT_300949 [Peniophora sp. CONT]|nr:hypothetical protein PENSPDRAFT_300949 [Peniophora sp. CONT]